MPNLTRLLRATANVHSKTYPAGVPHELVDALRFVVRTTSKHDFTTRYDLESAEKWNNVMQLLGAERVPQE